MQGKGKSFSSEKAHESIQFASIFSTEGNLVSKTISTTDQEKQQKSNVNGNDEQLYRIVNKLSI